MKDDLKSEIVRRFVTVTPIPVGQRWRVAGFGRRGGEVGVAVAVVVVKPRGAAHVLRFPDGKLDAFDAMDLFPA